MSSGDGGTLTGTSRLGRAASGIDSIEVNGFCGDLWRSTLGHEVGSSPTARLLIGRWSAARGEDVASWMECFSRRRLRVAPPLLGCGELPSPTLHLSG